jgi:NADH dehydrogenase
MILVAGGTGHLGTELVPLLCAQATPVRVLTRDPLRARQLFGDAVEVVPGDVRSPRSLAPAMTDVHAVVSAITGFGLGNAGPRTVDHEGNLNLIRAAEQAGVRRFVLVSMHGAAAEHPMELARMKHRAEESLRRSSLDWTIVRPTAFMKLWVGMIGDPIVKAGKTTVFGDGDNRVNFICERNVAEFVTLALNDPSLRHVAIDVGGPENLTFNDVVREIESAIGKQASVRHIPVPVMRISRLLMQPVRPDVGGMVEAGIAFDTTDMSLDVADVRDRFPQVELECVRDVVRQRFGAQGPDPGWSVTVARRAAWNR